MTTINTDYATNLPWIGWKNGHNEWLINLLESGSPKDITAYTFRLDIYKNDNTRGTPLLSLTQGEGLTNGTTAGTIRNVLTQTQAGTTLKGKDFYYVLSYTFDSKSFGLYKGKLTLVTGNNPGSTTTTTSATVVMAGEEGSFTSVTANVTLAGEGSAEESTFTSNPTLVLPSGHTFGKYANGDTPNWTGLTAIEAILDAITDYIAAVFTSFSITGQSTTVEVGTTLSGSKTFTWAITENSSDVNQIDIYDITGAANIATDTAHDGSQAVTITSKQLNSNGATQQWRGVAHDDNNDNDINSTTFTVTARYYRFYGPAASSPADSAAVRALPSSAFHTGAGSFNFNTGTSETKFVVALPPGVTISSVIDTDALNADITSEFILTGTVNVTDAGGTSRAYNIYEMNVGVPYDSAHDFTITTA